MSKEEYLQQMEIYLKKHLLKSEVSEILLDYGEYFEDGRRQNKSDTEISAKLGPPEIIAQQFIEESINKKQNTVEELGKIKDKAVSNMTLLKNKIKFPKIKNPVKCVTFASPSIFAKLIQFIKNIIKFCIKAVLAIVLLMATLFISFVYLLFLATVAIGTITIFITGISGFVLSSVSFQFISIFFTLVGFFGSTIIICFSILLAILFLYFAMGGIHIVRLAVKLLIKKYAIQEELTNE